MAKGLLDQFINALPSEIRLPLKHAFYHVVESWRLGTNDKADYGQLYRVQSTTASVALQEFSIPHGLGLAPNKLIPVLDLSQVNSQIVPLQVSRAPDAHRVYLKSTSTSAVFVAYVELLVLWSITLMRGDVWI